MHRVPVNSELGGELLDPKASNVRGDQLVDLLGI